MGRTSRRGVETALGLALALALVAGATTIYRSFRGDFSSDVVVSAAIAQAGDALEPGDAVTYRDIIVGEVSAASGDLAGGARLTLKIHRAAAGVIPAGVHAIAVPASLFGSTQINLVPPDDAGAGGPTLRHGGYIAADTSPAAEGLQTALEDAYTLLTSVHPAQLDAALSGVATALDGQGTDLGRLVDRADAYLERLIPALPHLDATITSFATVTRQLARDAPALLSSVANLLVVSQGVIAGQQAVAQLLNVAPTAVNNAQVLLNQRNVDNAVTVFRNEGPVFTALGARPDAVPKTIHGFKAFADSLSPTLAQGPYAKVNIILTGANLAALFNVALGGKGSVFNDVADPQPYSVGACPRYDQLPGPNCPPTAPSGGTVSSVGSPHEVATVRAATAAIGGLDERQVPAFTDLLLGPLLRGLPTVIR